jgi:hypothetical protein
MHELPFQTVTQFAGLGITLIAGWFLGLASHGGGRKWRERLEEAEIEHAGYREQAETDLRESARRIRMLEGENGELRRGVPTAPVAPEPAPAPEPEGHSTATVVGAAIAGAVAGAAVTHAVDEHAEAAHAEPAHHAEPEHHAEPLVQEHAEPAHADVAHGEVAHAEPAHPEHSH